jgi:fucose permease
MKKLTLTVFLVALLIAVPGLGFAQTIVNVVSDLTGDRKSTRLNSSHHG